MEAFALDDHTHQPNIIDIRDFVLPDLNLLEENNFKEIIYLQSGLARVLQEFDMVPSQDQMFLILGVISRLESLGVTRTTMLNFLRERYLYPWINDKNEIVDFTVSMD